MKTATITEVKNGLSGYIDRVKAGESILITDRGVPVAVIEPAAGHVDVGLQLSRLERDGIVRRRRGTPRVDLLATSPVKLGKHVDVVAALIDERRTGR